MDTPRSNRVAYRAAERRPSLHSLAASTRMAVGALAAVFSTAAAWVWEAPSPSTASSMPHPDGHVTKTGYRSLQSFQQNSISASPDEGAGDQTIHSFTRPERTAGATSAAPGWLPRIP